MQSFIEPSIGYGTTTELNDFNQPRLKSEAELIKDALLFILFTKPNQYPSLPHLGIDIESMLYSFYDDLDEQNLANQISSQCEALRDYFSDGTIILRKTKYRSKPSLMIHIQTSSNDILMRNTASANKGVDKYQIGITFDELNQMIHNISEGS